MNITHIIFFGGLVFGIGFVSGKFFKKLNPFMMILGIMWVAVMSVPIIQTGNDAYFYIFGFGFICNWGNPFRWLAGSIQSLKDSWLLARARSSHEEHLFSQKAEIEDNLRQQHENVEADLRHQQRNAEDEIKKAQEYVWEQAEKLKNDQAAFDKEKNSQKSSSSTQQQTDTRSHEEIIGVQAGYNKQELKAAYRAQCSRLHPDKWVDRPQEIRLLMEEEMKKVNRACDVLSKNTA